MWLLLAAGFSRRLVTLYITIVFLTGFPVFALASPYEAMQLFR